MTPADFRKLDWRRQNDWLEPYVMATLESLREPIPTSRTIRDVANRVGWLDASADYLPGANVAIGNVLRRFTRHKPGLATHDGEVFTFMGKETRRWMWHPQPKASLDGMTSVEAKRLEAARKGKEPWPHDVFS